MKKDFVLVERKALPEVIQKVLEAKRLILFGTAKNSTEACKLMDISRSAFYKYRDSVFVYQGPHNGIITLQLALEDEKGILSGVLAKLSECGMNILTVNQNIPVDAVANVTVSLQTEESSLDVDQLLSMVVALQGVIKAKTI